MMLTNFGEVTSDSDQVPFLAVVSISTPKMSPLDVICYPD